MARRSRLSILVDDALEILEALGLPMAGLTERRKTKMAKAFLSVACMKPGSAWQDARADHLLRSRDVIRWMNEHLDEDISSGSYDDIRRKDLLLPVEAGIVLNSAANQSAATNDGTRAFALSPEVAELVKYFGTSNWMPKLAEFLEGRQTLLQQLRRDRQQQLIPVLIEGEIFHFGPGEHNLLQKLIMEEFLSRFGHSAELLYVGDTQDKLLFIREDRLKSLGFFELAHDKLPDVIAYSATENWLYVIEAVHSANPITELRKRTLEQLTKYCTAEIVYVSAFLTRDAFRKFAKEIAWETEVWIAESPHHLVHFNGDKFLGPHKLKEIE